MSDVAEERPKEGDVLFRKGPGEEVIFQPII
jgi:hypothetical protein